MSQDQLLDTDAFVYYCDWSSSDNPSEPIEEYWPGGYHPITLGQHVVNPASGSDWRVTQKPGHGGYATVWLVQNAWAALRINRADYDSTGEADVLELIGSGSGIGLSHTITVLEEFSIQGPNGTHFAMVRSV